MSSAQLSVLAACSVLLVAYSVQHSVYSETQRAYSNVYDSQD
jgi:ABC-type sulfate transport system substrate-binding protein